MPIVECSPLSRVEGHGRVELHLEQGELVTARVKLLESPRLFESLVIGRHFREIPTLVCRICAICSTVHRVAAASAIEAALDLTIPLRAQHLRELALLGGQIESHALHLFCLVLPDLFNVDSLFALPQESLHLQAGLELKALGNRLQLSGGGRSIHPGNIEIGGVLTSPNKKELDQLHRDVEAWLEKIPPLLQPFLSAPNWPATPLKGYPLWLEGGEVPFSGRELVWGNRRRITTADYRSVLQEETCSYSNARKTRAQNRPFLTGALARRDYRSGDRGRTDEIDAEGIYANNRAQAEELMQNLLHARDLLKTLRQTTTDELRRIPQREKAGTGTALFEAPRGILVHHYAIDSRGRIAAADIITPTAINQCAMEAQLLSDLQGVAPETMEEQASRLIRAFDPCISCAVHLLKV